MNLSKPDEQAICARCGVAIDLADRFVISSSDGAGEAQLCRVEHIVAWVLRGAPWQLERPWESAAEDRAATGPIELARIRGDERIERSFDSPDELCRWASAGGLWGET
ncbi:MAG: hypothetical protein QM648_00845 [Solirubrobacterales bacterium]